MTAAVARIAAGEQEAAITDLLMSLPKRDRAMCLFNENILRQKVAEARMVLEVEDDEPAPAPATPATSTVPVTPATPVAKRAEAPQTPELSRAPSAAPSPLPTTPAPAASSDTDATYTLTTLAKLPAVEIVRIARAGTATGVPLPKTDPAVVSQTDAFIDGLLDKPVQQQKQALGDKL
jgi:polyadenylate-binding protein